MSQNHRQSRLSVHPRIGPRDSIFAGSSDLYRSDTHTVFSPNLRECVLAMEDCCDEAYEAQQLLRNGTFDLPRMTTILENQRVFLLIDESTVRKYKTDLRDEIEPQINELITRAEKGLKGLLKKEGLLHAKVEAAQSRPASQLGTGAASNKLESRRLQLLVKQRQRLEEELKQLESEVLTLAGVPCLRFNRLTKLHSRNLNTNDSEAILDCPLYWYLFFLLPLYLLSPYIILFVDECRSVLVSPFSPRLPICGSEVLQFDGSAEM
ncbi:hypothetical protein HETIRDRAFT_47371 [Heterobasidion irregulare TC 32-1]|uniref:DASH complex subunit SPC19 n=1 Tax=Heterobasidion irregulare (strain TC 32-1) TaxID=747525 RepID=W4KE03_HETIT|nr:uncharacterized protein HETIRDRAFT_47371 [Heterobasidion irregulare TC 32-1]ETW84087.1 hypothetical protein HETIRDRAFT_47371 [Heterobasidion irregulare TC 32-1]